MSDTGLKHCIKPYLSGKAYKFLSGNLTLGILIRARQPVVRGGAETWETSLCYATALL